MPRFDKLSVMLKMRETRMVPVFYHEDAATARQVVKACYDGGVRAFEFTNRGDFAHEVFADLVKWAATACPDLALGAGSVVDPATAVLYLQLGANFIVGPLLNPEVARICNRRSIAYIPGCATVSEMGQAQELGSEVTKLFPGDVYGPRMVKDLMAPCPWSKVMVTGGVAPDKDNLEQWFRAGAWCVGMGSKLFPKDLIANGDWPSITQKTRQALQAIREVVGAE